MKLPLPLQLPLPLLSATLLCLLCLLAACSKPPEPPTSDEPTVAGDVLRFPAKSPTLLRLLTAPVTRSAARAALFPARLAWDEDHTSRVTAPLAGRLSASLVQVGDAVKAGQTLATLTSADLGSAQADATRAQADAEQAQRSLQRTRELSQAGILAAKDLEQAEADLQRSRTEAQRTSLRIKTLGAASTVDQHLPLRSPISGIVVERNTNPGMEWRPDQPGAALFVISDPTYLWCWIDVPESASGQFKPGQTLRVRVGASADDSVEAQIDHVADTLDPVSHTLRVRAHLRNSARRLKAEMYVSAEFTSPPPGDLAVPAQAVFLSNAAQHLFVKTGPNEFTRRRIVPRGGDAQTVYLNEGVKPGDQVVTDGALFLLQLRNAAAQPGKKDKDGAP